jgi:MFS family permease
MKRIFLITFLNFFISGGLTLIIPLLLLERNVDLLEIGIILSILPLVFMFIRLLIAYFADSRGWNRIHLLLNCPGSVLSIFFYLIANSTPLFLFGKIIEAIKESSYWAVNRTAIFSLSPNKEVKEATRNTSIIFLSIAVGSAVAGIAISYFGFSITLLIFMISAFFIAVPALSFWRKTFPNSRNQKLNFNKIIDSTNYNARFWLTSLTMMLFSLSFYPLLNLLIPVFMSNQLGYDYFTIGVSYMLFNLITSVIIVIALKFSLNLKRVFIQITICLIASVLLAFLNPFFIILFFMLAMSEGLGMGFFEAIIAKTTKGKPSVSLDIGLLHIPMRIAEFISLLYAGYIAETIGFSPVFIISGVFFLFFSVLAFYLLKK